MLAVSCVKGSDFSNCTPETCNGCCDSNGQCHHGNDTSSCGAYGTVCSYCGSSAKCFGYVCEECGDRKCSGSETCSSCPSDCGTCCGNGACSLDESCSACPSDCGACLGAYARCISTTQCAAGYVCHSFQGSSGDWCRKTGCTTNADCPPLQGNGNLRFCDVNSKLCVLECVGASGPCPNGAKCMKFTSGAYGYCD